MLQPDRLAVLAVTALGFALWAGISAHVLPHVTQANATPVAALGESTMHPLNMPEGGATEGRLVAIVIDDMGLDRAASLAALTLPGRLTYSFLPYGPATGDVAQKAKQQGDEVAVHMPMQPWSKVRNPGPDALTLDLSVDELERRIEANLARVPGYSGVNNHMGSRFSERPEGLSRLFAALEKRDVWYLDSRTSRGTVADVVAGRLPLRYARRDVFLDDGDARLPFWKQLAEVERRAQAQGAAVLIAHPHPASLRALRNWLQTAEARGYRTVTMSELIAANGQRKRAARLLSEARLDSAAQGLARGGEKRP